MTGLGRYAAVVVGIVLVAGAVLVLVFHGPDARMAIGVSAVLAVVVQLGAGVVSGLPLMRANVMARMGAGALIRLVALVAYGLIVVEATSLPAVPALIGLFVFFFLTTLVEPLLIKP
ncbi:MAG TPA: hypothetical protein VHB25_04835 [Gemmatimonadaceae bacterium]|nr:hypothetical protein [Gemmatimonadaceae bacterium]